MAEKKVTFTKNDSSGTWETTFEQIEGDKLHPCVLFYFSNDEVEFLPK